MNPLRRQTFEESLVQTIYLATTPRHLAGPGHPRFVTQLLRAAGWVNLSDPDHPHVALASPDRRHTLALEPGAGTREAGWHFTERASHNDVWHARFGSGTPVEIISGFTDALITPAPETAPEVWPHLTGAGWTRLPGDRVEGESAVHPDGHVALAHRSGEPDLGMPWVAEASVPRGLSSSQVWRAYFSDSTPLHLVAGFAAALADRRPVQRGYFDVPHAYLVSQERGGPQGEELLAMHDQRLKQVRAATRRARKAAERPPAPPPTAGTARSR